MIDRSKKVQVPWGPEPINGDLNSGPDEPVDRDIMDHNFFVNRNFILLIDFFLVHFNKKGGKQPFSSKKRLFF